MATGPLTLVYSTVVLLTAILGIAFVFSATGDNRSNWAGLLAALVVGAYLVVMVGAIAT